MRFLAVLSVCASALLPVVGCGDDDDGDDRAADAGPDATVPPIGCGPTGESVACVGPGGCDGAQVCSGDGSYGECDCGDDPASGCAPSGIVARCVGEDRCDGYQTCGANGSFGACECPDPTAGAVTALAITSPEAGAIVENGTLEVTGTAAGSIARIAVSIGGGPLLAVEGEENWTLSYDVSDLPDGLVTIVAVAIGEDGSELSRWRQVRVRNVDPLVGTWFRTDPAYRPGDDWTYCVVTLNANGAVDATECPGYSIFYYTVIWQRESGDVVHLDNADRGLVATVTDDGETLEVRYSPDFRETYMRVHGEPPPRDQDAGVDDGEDAGSP